MKKWERNWDIKEVYPDWKASGLTQVEYCKRKGISFTRFKNQTHRKRQELNKAEQSLANGRFTAISVKGVGAASEDTTKKPYCEITFAGEHTVSFSDKASLHSLKALISDLIQI